MPHMSTGHAFSRALRAQFLTRAALATIILKSSNILDASKEKLSQIYESLIMGDSHFQGVIYLDNVAKLLDNINEIYNEIRKATERLNCVLNTFRLCRSCDYLSVQSEQVIGTSNFMLLNRCFKDTCSMLNPLICTYNRSRSFQQKLPFCLISPSNRFK